MGVSRHFDPGQHAVRCIAELEAEGSLAVGITFGPYRAFAITLDENSFAQERSVVNDHFAG
jgi:hypothetical protein